ncbi:MAG: hypothetical protein CBE33_03960 [Candidatus Pelagibacter sp. TMED273]|nr:MAG: hypothetical protein CBE33_03960 [Candidatus Pelagibacter sp. TMED273]|tara:strand:- start:2407 stop:3423 length:1017 start_codon:yes stop_codon:yes gene_type:complete
MDLNLNFNFIITIIGIIIFVLIKKNNKFISEKLGLIDYASQEKIHKKNTSLIAIFPFFILFLIIHLFLFFNYQYNIDTILIFVFAIGSFLIGIFDDKKNLGYSIKFIFFGALILFILLMSNNLLLERFYFSTFNKLFLIGELNSTLVTTLCLLLLINAINLSDGINGLCSGIILIWLLYFQINFDQYINLYPLIALLFITTIFIYKGIFFLGNAGSHFLSSYVGIISIYCYNQNLDIYFNKSLSVEDIFIVFMLPGFDMLRLFIVRISNKKNPFSSDLNHLHHLLIKKFSLIETLIIYILSIVLPILANHFELMPSYLIILIFGTFYLFGLYSLKKIN